MIMTFTASFTTKHETHARQDGPHKRIRDESGHQGALLGMVDQKARRSRAETERQPRCRQDDACPFLTVD